MPDTLALLRITDYSIKHGIPTSVCLIAVGTTSEQMADAMEADIVATSDEETYDDEFTLDDSIAESRRLLASCGSTGQNLNGDGCVDYYMVRRLGGGETHLPARMPG